MKTGYLFASDHMAHLALQSFFRHTGKWLPALRPVLSIDGKRLLNPDFGHFATVAFDWQLGGRLVLDELNRLVMNQNAVRRELEMKGDIIC